jgi:hypothetical protein
MPLVTEALHLLCLFGVPFPLNSMILTADEIAEGKTNPAVGVADIAHKGATSLLVQAHLGGVEITPEMLSTASRISSTHMDVYDLDYAVGHIRARPRRVYQECKEAIETCGISSWILTKLRGEDPITWHLKHMEVPIEVALDSAASLMGIPLTALRSRAGAPGRAGGRR